MVGLASEALSRGDEIPQSNPARISRSNSGLCQRLPQPKRYTKQRQIWLALALSLMPMKQEPPFGRGLCGTRLELSATCDLLRGLPPGVPLNRNHALKSVRAARGFKRHFGKAY